MHFYARSWFSPYQTYVGIQVWFTFALAIAYTTSIVYWVQAAHLGPLELILLGTVLELAYLIFQLPTGVLADTVSRRLCVVLGVGFTSLGFLLQGASPTLVALMGAQILVGLGAALLLGAQEAWLADEAGKSDLTSVFLRGAQISVIGTIVGSLLSGLIASAGLFWPFLVGGGLLGLLTITLALVMPENHFVRPDDTLEAVVSARVGVSTLLRQTVRTWKVVHVLPGALFFLLMSFFLGMWSESFDRLWGAYLIKDVALPHPLHIATATWFSLIAVIASLLSVGSTELAKRRTDRLGRSSIVATLLVSTVVTGIAVVAMVMTRSFVPVLVSYLVVGAIRPVFAPLTAGWMVAHVPPSVRATALSAVDMFNSGGQILGGPAIGVVGELASIRVAILAGAGALAPAVALLLAATKRSEQPSAPMGDPPSGRRSG